MEHIFNDVRCTIKLIDGTPTTPLEHTLDADLGTLSVGPLKKTLIESESVFRKGRIYGRAPTNRIVPEGSFEGILGVLSEATTETVQSFVLGLAPFAARVSTMSGAEHEFACDVEVTWAAETGGTDQVLLMEDVVITIDQLSSASPNNTISFSFEVLGRISFNGTVVADEIA